MGDVAQILGIQASAANADASEVEQLKALASGSNASQRSAMSKHRAKKVTGMQREVLELLESNHRVNHAMYPGMSKPSLIQKWKQHKGPAVQW